jgi:amidase
MRIYLTASVVCAVALLGAQISHAKAAVQIEEASIGALQAMMADGSVTSQDITAAYLARIAQMDRKGPALHAVIAVNPDAFSAARESDARRRAKKLIGPLDGIPILIKDNIETKDPIATTAGSLALKDNITGRDAPVVARLRAAGAIIIGKTNLSEWANFRSPASVSGWSAIGGLVRNPYALDRTTCGSSSGSAAAVAASFAAGAIGTETDGSLTCPASMTAVVALKPTMGLISRTHIVPISPSQDSAGPMARSVRDVAQLLTAMIAADPADPATAGAGRFARDFSAGLSRDALLNVRIAVLRPEMPQSVTPQYERALAALKSAGAILVEANLPPGKELAEAEVTVLLNELKGALNGYLATTADKVEVRSLNQLIAFNIAHADNELAFFGQELLLAADEAKGVGNPAYIEALDKSRRLARAEGIDAILKSTKATIIVQPSFAMPWLSDPVYGDNVRGSLASTLPSVAGYPHLTVPMGLVKGLPVGLSFIGPAHSDAQVLGAGYAYEQD